MNIEGPAPVIALVDLPLVADFHPAGQSREHKVPVQDLDELGGNSENQGIRGKAGRNGKASVEGFSL